MEITQENFEAQFPLIQESILKADFIAIDSEFSGHSASLDDKGHDYDTVEERYQKLRFTCSKFIAFQFGICTFNWDDKSKSYKCRPFSFYVFPKSKIYDTSMLFQADSVSFLTRNNFDFNKLFALAITFTPLGKKDQLRQDCKFKVTKTTPSLRSFTSLSTAHQKKLEDMMRQIDEWVYDTNSGEKLTFMVHSYSLKKALSKEVTKQYIKTGVFTEFQRGSIETVIKKSKHFKQRNFMRGVIPAADDKDSQSSLGFQLSDEEIKEEIKKSPLPEAISVDAQKKADKLEVNALYQSELGFSRVIELLMKCGKPIVGHNMIFDIGFIYRQFISKDFDMPKTYDEFAKQWRANIPSVIYDTKVLAESCGTSIFGKTDLQTIFLNCKKEKKLNNNIVIEYDKGKDSKFGLYENIQQLHDAGYDAYMTGSVFLKMSKYIEIGKIIAGKEYIPSSKQSSQASTVAVSATKSKSVTKGDLLTKRTKRFNSNDEEEKVNIGETVELSRRKIKHYSAVQNKPLYYDDLKYFENKIMLSIDIPRYFYLERGVKLSQVELDFDMRMKECVIFVQMKEVIGANKIADLFNIYGDINVIKNTSHSCFIEFSFIDSDIVHSKKLSDLMKKAEIDLSKTNRGLILKILNYENAPRFICKDMAIPFA